MPVFRADLHIHSCLSPCGSLDSSPRAIAAAARSAGMDMAAITDHNCALNAPAFEAACRREGIIPLFGLELTTREEVHVLGLFPTAGLAVRAGEEAYERLESGPFDAGTFGDQVWVDEDEEVLGMPEKLLIIGTTDLSLEDAGEWVRKQGGLFIPAHIDRQAFGILGVLGFLPAGPFDAVESTIPLESGITGPWTVTASSDAHYPADIGGRHTKFTARKADFDELAKALAEGKAEPRFAPN